MNDLSARYFDGQSARQIDATVQLGPEALVVRDDQATVLAIWPLDEVRLVGKPEAGRPLRLTRLKGTARVVVADAGRLGDLERLCPDLHKLRPRARDVWRPVALWSALAVGVVAALFLVVIPYLARQAALAIPPDIETEMGAAAAEQVAGFFTPGKEAQFCSSPEGQRALDVMARELSAHADLPFPLTVRVIKVPIVNALTLPGGQILLFSKLLGYAESPNEVAGVLAHEIGHVVRRHPMEVFVKNVGAATLVGFLLGDITGGSVIAALAQLTVTSAYTREAERQADVTAVDLLNAAGIDGAGLAAFFQRLLDKRGSKSLDDVFAIINTHPATGERAEFVRSHVTGTKPALSDAQWRALKSICGAT